MKSNSKKQEKNTLRILSISSHCALYFSINRQVLPLTGTETISALSTP